MMPSNLTIKLIGNLEVRRDGAILALPQSKKTRALLAYLILKGSAERREDLCQLLWDVPDDPKGALRWSLSKLRPLLNDAEAERLAADRERVKFERCGAAIDIFDVEALCADGLKSQSHQTLVDVSRACMGTLLAGLDLPQHPSYESWRLGQQDRARKLHRRILDELLARTENDPLQHSQHLRARIELDPDDQDAHIALVAHLAASGQRADATAQADISIRMLKSVGFVDAGLFTRALQGSPREHPAARAPSPIQKPSIAVLPFANSGTPIDDYFVEGMADAITDALSCFGWLFVIARQSAFTFQADANPRQVAQELSVRYLLTGTMLRGADRVRVTCRLIDGETGEQVWLERFDRESRDIFELLDEIVSGVAARLEPNILQADARRSRRKPTEALDAYDYYLRALQLTYQPPGRDEAEAIALFEEALRRDPEFAPALVTLAYLRLQGKRYRAPVELEETVWLARQAVQYGQDDSRVLALAGYILGSGAREFDAADVLIERALVLNPNSYVAWIAKGWANTYWGDTTQALPCFDVAERLSPRDPLLYVLQTGRASALFQAGRFNEAEILARTAAAANSAYETSLRYLTASLADLGRIDEARGAFARLRQTAPHEDLAFLRRTLPFRPASRVEPLCSALSRAGMPEHVGHQ